MKLSKKLLIPLATIGTLGATVAPICLTSCGRAGLMGTHDMLNPYYVHHVAQAIPRTIIGKGVAVDAYAQDAQVYTDIIKDDILFTYSKILTNDLYKNNINFDFTNGGRYFLYVDGIQLVKEGDTWQLKMNLWAEITAETKSTILDTFKFGNKHIRDLTAIVGASYSMPLVFDNTKYNIIDLQSSPFHGLPRMDLSFATNGVKRVWVDGVLGLSDTTTSQIVYTSVAEDVTAATTETGVDLFNIFNQLIGSVPAFGLDGNNAQENDFPIVSHYFGTVEVK